MLRRASKKFSHFDKKLFDTLLKGVYKENMKGGERFPAGLMEERTMAGKKSVMLHAIKTNRFSECTWILEQIWNRLRNGLNGIHFTNASYRECCIMRGWSVCYPELFSFTSTHDLCDASFTRKGMERLVMNLYENELESHKSDYPAVWSGTNLDEYIWEICK